MNRPTSTTIDTPFGAIDLVIREAHGQRTALLHDMIDPRAAIYAAKVCGVERIVERVTAESIDRLLPASALIVPHDTIDLTVGRAATFFVGRGYGFLSQQHVFCPQLRGAAITACGDQPAAFARGTLAVVDRMDDPIDPRWAAQLRARSGAPAAYLAKELELCYLPLCVIGALDQAAWISLVDDLLGALPQERSCPCATAMRATRERGLIGDDWRGWL